ncbi:hypothetical protein AB0J30_08855 [Streptomyces microflavus]|uniref:hypothetical protein n=1 Tax=Streptomyces microflavus TaxID=1919 RepID=UPI0034302183
MTTTGTHPDPIAAAAYVPSRTGSTHQQLAFQRIHNRAVEAFHAGQHDAARLDLKAPDAHAHTVDTILAAVGPAYAAAAINQAAATLVTQLDENTYLALGGIAATLDLAVVEDLDGANGGAATGASDATDVRHERR